jgi:hypothetical protein
MRTLHEVRDGWYVGAWVATHSPANTEEAAQRRRWSGVLDLTCELPRRVPAHPDTAYCTLPTWDGTPPALTHIQTGVDFLRSARRRGPVLGTAYLAL